MVATRTFPRLPRRAEPLSEPRLTERWLLSELFSALGSVIFFHPWKGNPLPFCSSAREPPSEWTGPGGEARRAASGKEVSPRLMTR